MLVTRNVPCFNRAADIEQRLVNSEREEAAEDGGEEGWITTDAFGSSQQPEDIPQLDAGADAAEAEEDIPDLDDVAAEEDDAVVEEEGYFKVC